MHKSKAVRECAPDNTVSTDALAVHVITWLLGGATLRFLAAPTGSLGGCGLLHGINVALGI